MKTTLTALFLLALLSSAALPLAAHPGVPAGTAALSHVAVPAGSAPEPDFGAWLARQEAGPAPAFQLAACRTCSQCPPSQPFCCILASGCASCTSRPVACAPGGLKVAARQ